MRTMQEMFNFAKYYLLLFVTFAAKNLRELVSVVQLMFNIKLSSTNHGVDVTILPTVSQTATKINVETG